MISMVKQLTSESLLLPMFRYSLQTLKTKVRVLLQERSDLDYYVCWSGNLLMKLMKINEVDVSCSEDWYETSDCAVERWFSNRHTQHTCMFSSRISLSYLHYLQLSGAMRGEGSFLHVTALQRS